MKKILTSLALLGTLVTGAYAQKTVDLSIHMTNPADNATYANLANGDSLVFNFYTVNHGPDAVVAADSFEFFFLGHRLNINDGFSYAGQSLFYTGAALAAGDTLPLSFTVIKGNYAVTSEGDTIVNFFPNNTTQEIWFTSGDITDTFSYYLDVIGKGAGGWFIDEGIEFEGGNPSNWTGNNVALAKNVTFGDPTSILTVAGLEKEAISVYPNPTTNKLSFKYNFTKNTNATVNVTDVTGRTVLVKELGKQSVGQKEFTLDVSSLSNGLYNMELITDDKRAVSKFNVSK